MRIPEPFDDPSDITIPNHDSGSLRPHILAPDDFALGEWARPTLLSRLGAGPFVAMGIVVGMAAALPVAAWAVHTHRWPSIGSLHATAAPMAQLCPAALPSSAPVAASSPALDRTTGTLAPTAQAIAETSTSPADPGASPHEKARKKRRGPSKRAIGHPDRAKLLAEGNATTEARGAAPLPRASSADTTAEPSSGDPAVSGDAETALTGRKGQARAVAHDAPSKPAPPVEDQAAAELSTSLK
jgi:hypothetical protein